MADHALNDLLERYATLRDTILGLEAEKEEIAGELKAALQRGELAETPLYRAELRTSSTTEYPTLRFRQMFGDAATLEVATIDRKKADALAKAGDLDAQALHALALRRARTPSLVLVAVRA
jgi:predicted phage-related endonuclease